MTPLGTPGSLTPAPHAAPPHPRNAWYPLGGALPSTNHKDIITPVNVSMQWEQLAGDDSIEMGLRGTSWLLDKLAVQASVKTS